MSDPATPWAELAELGEFFEFAPPGQQPASGPSWRPLAELISDPAVLAERISITRQALAELARRPAAQVDRRIAGSIFEQGLAARLISPLFGLAVLRGELATVGVADLRWRPVGTGVRLGLATEPVRITPERTKLASRFGELVLARPVADLLAAINGHCRLSPLVAWGNVGSAVNGAAVVLAARRPDLASSITGFTRAVLCQAPLNMLDPQPGGRFRRRSCCLLYRAMPAGRAAVCTDCVLNRPAGPS